MPDLGAALSVDVLSTGGLSALVGWLILAYFRGWIIPKPQVDRLEEAYKRQLTDAWAAKAAADAARDVSQSQLNRLLEAAYPVLRTVNDEAS